MFDEFGERELSEVIVESVKKLARLLDLVILCLYTMKAGEEDVETLDAEGTEESFFCNGAEREEAAGGLYGSGLEAEEAADGLYASGVEDEEAVGDLYAGGTGEERQVGSSGGDRAEAWSCVVGGAWEGLPIGPHPQAFSTRNHQRRGAARRGALPSRPP